MLTLRKFSKLRMNYPPKKDNYFLTLKEYTLLAKKCICKFVPVLASQLLKNDDFITDITHDIMMADWRWNGKGSRIGYRSKCAKWSILKKIKRKKKHIYTISLDDEITVYGHKTSKNGIRTKRIKDLLEDTKIKYEEVTEDLLKPFSLTSTQKEYLLRNINGENPLDIAKDKGVTPQYVSLILKHTKERMRKFYDKKSTL